ncbi:hypothetical protein GCM10010519_17690 [Streptomyces lactacystinicus]
MAGAGGHPGGRPVVAGGPAACCRGPHEQLTPGPGGRRDRLRPPAHHRRRGRGRRDVTADQCRSAGGHVEGSGYCVDAAGEDGWGQPIDGQAINPDPRPGEE